MLRHPKKFGQQIRHLVKWIVQDKFKWTCWRMNIQHPPDEWIFSSWTSKQGPVGELCPCYYWLLKIHVPCTKAPGMMHGVYNENWKLLYLMKLHVIIDSLFFITSVLPRAAYWRGNAPEPSTTKLVPKLTVVWRKGPHRGGFMKQHNCIVPWWKEDVMMLALVRVESGFDLLYYGSIRYGWS